MIDITLSKKILNALFHTGGSVGPSAADEKNELVNEGVMWGAAPGLYCLAYQQDGYAIGKATAKLNESKNAISKTEWWYTVNETEKIEFKNNNGETVSQNFTGWSVKQNDNQNPKYAGSAYLALFTIMPNENGEEYAEPIADSSGNFTTYMRVNLLDSIVSGSKSMANAVADEETGVATITNSELILYPEVYGIDWGTIVGIGVFKEEAAGTGKPQFWGRINTPVAATTDHVPLFRVGDLKVTLS